MKKLILIFFIAFLFGIPIFATETDYTTDCGTFKFENTTGEIKGYTGSSPHITIPYSFGGVNVTKIYQGAFQENTYIKTIIIPASISTIGRQAFHSCTSLTAIYFKGNAPSIGDNIFYGVNKSYKTYINQNANGFPANIWAERPIEVINLDTYHINTTISNNSLNVTIANTPFIDKATLICSIYNKNKLIKPLLLEINKNANTYNYSLSNYQKPFWARIILIDKLSNLNPLTYSNTVLIE
jgi:hypothetical protein